MVKQRLPALGKRERQIMEVIQRLDGASAAAICGLLPDPPTYSAVRASLAVLERKGHVRHEKMGRQYIYFPVAPRRDTALASLREVVDTFFRGSTAQAVAALLTSNSRPYPPLVLDRLKKLLDRGVLAKGG